MREIGGEVMWMWKQATTPCQNSAGSIIFVLRDFCFGISRRHAICLIAICYVQFAIALIVAIIFESMKL